MLDFHGKAGTPGTALAFIEAVKPFNPMFVEEPIQPGDLKSLARIADKANVPIAAGERLIERTEFDALFQARAVDVAQPDIAHCGGLLEAKKIAAMAEAASIGVAPHNPLGPIAGVAALHFAVPRRPTTSSRKKWSAAVVFRGGQGTGSEWSTANWQVPEAPGLGIEVDEKVCAAHPFEPGGVPHHASR